MCNGCKHYQTLVLRVTNDLGDFTEFARFVDLYRTFRQEYLIGRCKLGILHGRFERCIVLEKRRRSFNEEFTRNRRVNFLLVGRNSNENGKSDELRRMEN